MARVRLAWAALAGLGLLSGCMSYDPCCRPSLMQRIGSRMRCGCACATPCCTTAQAIPVSAMPVTSELPLTPGCPSCGGGGPILPPVTPGFTGGPDFVPGSILPEGGPVLPYSDMSSGPIVMPGGPTQAPPLAPPLNGAPAPSTLPTPTPIPGSPPQLTPVPNGGLAPRTPAPPTSRRRN